MMAEGKSDSEIIEQLGLEEKVSFKMDKKYLKNLFGFVTARNSISQDWTRKALDYGYASSLDWRNAP